MLVQQGAGVGDPDTNWKLESKPDPERTLEIQTGSGSYLTINLNIHVVQ